MNQSNIVKCSICNAPLIYEELKDHECCTKKVIEFVFDTDRNEYHMFDGKKWYRWFPNWLLPPKTKHPSSTPDD